MDAPEVGVPARGPLRKGVACGRLGAPSQGASRSPSHNNRCRTRDSDRRAMSTALSLLTEAALLLQRPASRRSAAADAPSAFLSWTPTRLAHRAGAVSVQISTVPLSGAAQPRISASTISAQDALVSAPPSDRQDVIALALNRQFSRIGALSQSPTCKRAWPGLGAIAFVPVPARTALLQRHACNRRFSTDRTTAPATSRPLRTPEPSVEAEPKGRRHRLALHSYADRDSAGRRARPALGDARASSYAGQRPRPLRFWSPAPQSQRWTCACVQRGGDV